MRPPVFLIAAIALATASCAIFKSHTPPPAPPHPLFAGQTATLDITAGMAIAGAAAMPPGFTPVPGWAPMWLLGDGEIGVAGRLGNRTAVFALSGKGLASRREIGEDFGPLASDGRIVDIAASPNGAEIATAVAASNPDRLEVMIANVLGGDKGAPIATFNGAFAMIALAWLDNSTLALMLRPAPSALSAQPGQSPLSAASASPSSPPGGLYLINRAGRGSVIHLDRIKCPLARMVFSPNGRFAASNGAPGARPVIVDLHWQTCAPYGPRTPVRVLGWSPDAASFLYAGPIGPNGLPGTFRFDLKTGATSVVAIASAAVAFASDGTVVALGDNQLTWRRAADRPNGAIKSEIALFSPIVSEIVINSLGFGTSPAMLVNATMVLTPATDDAAIDFLTPRPRGPFRMLIDYSYPARQAFLLASGLVRGPLLMSWSPNGRMLAILDGAGGRSMLTVIAPPR